MIKSMQSSRHKLKSKQLATSCHTPKKHRLQTQANDDQQPPLKKKGTLNSAIFKRSTLTCTRQETATHYDSQTEIKTKLGKNVEIVLGKTPSVIKLDKSRAAYAKNP